MDERVLLKVAGSAYMYKDVHNGTVINTNEEEIRLARESKRLRKEERLKKDAMETDIAELKKDFAELKELIKSMVEKY
jgi:hypothetical protein